MKTRKVVLFLCVVLTILFSFCQKKDPNPSQPSANTTSGTYSNPPKPYRTEYISKELREWAVFNVGSYWIYNDSINGIIDSVYVSSIDSTFYRYNSLQDSDIVYESINVHFGSTYGFSDYSLNTGDYIFGSNRVSVFKLDTAKTSVTIWANIDIPQLSVFGNNYNNVRYFYFWENHQAQSAFFIITEKNYWAKNIGVIKRRGYQSYYGGFNQNLELIRYNVAQ